MDKLYSLQKILREIDDNNDELRASLKGLKLKAGSCTSLPVRSAIACIRGRDGCEPAQGRVAHLVSVADVLDLDDD